MHKLWEQSLELLNGMFTRPAVDWWLGGSDIIVTARQRDASVTVFVRGAEAVEWCSERWHDRIWSALDEVTAVARYKLVGLTFAEKEEPCSSVSRQPQRQELQQRNY